MGKEIFVLGMHRTGTSLVTHLIHGMGAYFGEIDQEMRPSDDNPKGFWERNDVLEINDAILKLDESNWFTLSHFDPEQCKIPVELEQTMESTLISLNECSPWVIKDPRNCLTFPIWEKKLEAPVIIIPFRSPLEVAKSLMDRNSFPAEFSLALWQKYVVSALRYSKDLPTIFIEYEKLVNDPIKETEILYHKLVQYGVKGLQLPSDLLIKDIIDPSLKHASVSQAKEKDQLQSDQLALLEMLRAKDVERLQDVINSINDNDNNQILKSWENKIAELFERAFLKRNRITSTLFSANESKFSLNNSIRITQQTEENNKTLSFYIDASFQIGEEIKVDIIDDISIFQLKSISISGENEVQIDSEEITTNAFYRIGTYLFFDQVPSSIYFSLPKDLDLNGKIKEISIKIDLIGKGVAVLPHVNQFHKNFNTYIKEKGRDELGEIEDLIKILVAGKDRALIKAQMLIAGLEVKNHKLFSNIQSLSDQNSNYLQLVSSLTTNLELEVKKAEDLAHTTSKLFEDIRKEKAINADLNLKLGTLESALTEDIRREKEANTGLQLKLETLESTLTEKVNDQADKIDHLINIIREKERIIGQLEHETTNLRGSFSNQIGRALTFPGRIIFDILTKKKPFNQTRLWWVKQYLVHPKAVIGEKDERERLKKGWLNQRHATAHLLSNTFTAPEQALEDNSLDQERRELTLLDPLSKDKHRWSSRKKIIYVSPNLPDYDTSSGGKRATRMLGLLAEEFDVYAFTLGSKPQKYIDELQRLGVIVIRTVDHREIHRKLPDVDTIIYAWYETYFSSAPFRDLYPDAKIIVDSVDVHWVREKRSIGVWKGLTEERVAANRKREKEAYQNADIIWAVTEIDKNAVLAEIPRADVRVVSNVHEPAVIDYVDNQKNTLLFIGGYNHYPNISAAIILAQQIFPEVRKSVPDARLIIAGANAPSEVEALSEIEGVIFKGFIQENEIEELYAQSFLTVSPLLAGAGIKGKICESIAYMTPVVTNDIGNEGIDLMHEEEGLISPIEQMPHVVIKALRREYDFEKMTKKAQEKLFGLVGSNVVKERMVNSILPGISICIVTWNRLDLVKRCIESIEGNTFYPNYKILVHSNGCTDGTQDYLKAAANINPKITPILSKKNDVFVLPNNRMMEMYPENDVILLNNDVYVTSGWLTALYEAAYSSTDYGIAGSKILYPDGRLQEFGSELYENGTGRNIGKFDDSDKEEYKKLTEVGYVSGCSMYIKRNTIKTIGVFDEQFHPCYCEDSDYCYTAKENGIKTVVTPDSVIFHDEGGTSGTDTSTGMKRYQVINMEKFLRKHAGKTNGIKWSHVESPESTDKAQRKKIKET